MAARPVLCGLGQGLLGCGDRYSGFVAPPRNAGTDASFFSELGVLSFWVRELETVRQLTMSSGPTSRERQLMSCISELLAREEIMEKQRSRITWLKDGDRNTKMFQAKAKERARCNKISALY